MNPEGQNTRFPGAPNPTLKQELMNQIPPQTANLLPFNGLTPGNLNAAGYGMSSAGIQLDASTQKSGSFHQTAQGSFNSAQYAAYQQTVTGSAISVESAAQSLGAALNEVPWMQFQVIAQPNLNLFMSDPRLQAFIQSLTRVTVASVTEEIVQQFNQTIQLLIAGINQTVAARMTSVTQSVLQQITSLASVGGATAFQTLGTVGINGMANGIAVDPASSGFRVSASGTFESTSNGVNAFGDAATGRSNNGIPGWGMSPGTALPGLSFPAGGIQPRKNHRFDCPNKDDRGECNCPIDGDSGKGRKKHRPDCLNKDDQGYCNCPDDAADNGGGNTSRKKHRLDCPNKDDRGTCGCPNDDGSNTSRKRHRPDCLNKDDRGTCGCPVDNGGNTSRKKHRPGCANKDDRGTCGCPDDDGGNTSRKKHRPGCLNKDDTGTCGCPVDDGGNTSRKKHRPGCANKDDRGSCGCPDDDGGNTSRKKHRPGCLNKDDRGTCGCPDDDGGDTRHKKHRPDCQNKNDKGYCHCPGDDDRCPPLNPNQKPINVPPPDLATGTWIWTKEVIAGGGTVPGGARPFRKVITTNCPVNRLTVDITCDNFYTLYVNGKLVGSGMNYQVPQRYTVVFESTNRVLVAIFAGQDPGSLAQVGLICAGVVWNSQEEHPQGIPFNTDATWKTFASDKFDLGFFKENYDDKGWENAVVEVPYGGGVWGAVARPIVNNVPGSGPAPNQGALTRTPANTNVPQAPYAPNAKVISLNDGAK